MQEILRNYVSLKIAANSGQVKESAGQSDWIAVEERLPEDGNSALVFIPQWEDYLRYQVAWIDYDERPPSWVNHGDDLQGVTHWMPLPAPAENAKGE